MYKNFQHILNLLCQKSTFFIILPPTNYLFYLQISRLTCSLSGTVYYVFLHFKYLRFNNCFFMFKYNI